jgi:hypothetical protein
MVTSGYPSRTNRTPPQGPASGDGVDDYETIAIWMLGVSAWAFNTVLLPVDRSC